MADEDQVTRRVTTSSYGTPAYDLGSRQTYVTESVRRTPSWAEMLRRIVVFVFALIQALIVLRIVLLLVDASQANAIVNWVLDTSQWFVAPFEGILRTDALHAGAAVLDVAAVVALIGWTILEWLIVAGIGVLRREP